MNKEVNQANKWINGIDGFVNLGAPPTKEFIESYLLDKMFKLSTQMFEYKNLPSTIPQWYLELLLQTNGHVIFTKHENKYYIFKSSLSGELNYNYQPTKAVVANPYLNLSKEYTIDEDCILCKNDCTMTGLLNNHRLYAWLITDSIISLDKNLINNRSEYIPISANDNQMLSWKEFFKALEHGDMLPSITDSDFAKNINTLPFSAHSMDSIKSVIESLQYLYGQWFSTIGLQAIFNMKREYISSDETAMNRDTLSPVSDGMHAMRIDFIDQINSKYGLNIKVDFSSVWKNNKYDKESSTKIIEKEVNANEN